MVTFTQYIKSSVTRAGHLSISPSLPRSIIRIQHSHLLASLIACTEGIPALLPHTLHLSDLAHSFLELLHTRSVVLDVVLLNLLDVVVCLWEVHPLRVLPREISH